jgi:Mor family transcriptional regulator
MSLENKDRNKKLYQDYNSGKYSIVELVSEYQISAAAIYKIIARFEKGDEDEK